MTTRFSHAADDAGDAGLVSYPPCKNAPPPLVNPFFNAIPGPAWGSWGWPWSTASVISADDADDADDSSNPVGKVSGRQFIKWAGNVPRIIRIIRKPFAADRGSFLRFSPCGCEAARDLARVGWGHILNRMNWHGPGLLRTASTANTLPIGANPDAAPPSGYPARGSRRAARIAGGEGSRASATYPPIGGWKFFAYKFHPPSSYHVIVRAPDADRHCFALACSSGSGGTTSPGPHRHGTRAPVRARKPSSRVGYPWPAPASFWVEPGRYRRATHA